VRPEPLSTLRIVQASARVHAWSGEAAVTLAAGAFSATFLPEVGMLGVSMTVHGEELLALPRSLADYRAGMPNGGYTGLPLNAPYANRLSKRRFALEGRRVELDREVAEDRHGTPIHGTMHARAFSIDHLDATGTAARLIASFRHSSGKLLRAFPFEHVVSIAARVDGRGLALTTAITTDERVRVPVSFGWHPFLRVPRSPRAGWRLRLPPRRHAVLDDRLLPTGRECREPAEFVSLADRSFDDHYALGSDRRFELFDRRHRVVVRFGAGFPYAQIYVPPPRQAATGTETEWTTRDFACIEPMTAPVDALVTGAYPVATRSAPFRAKFTILAGTSGPAAVPG